MQNRFLALLIPSALALSSCVAAALPVLAGGAVARSTTRDHGRTRASESRPAPAPQTTAAAASTHASSPVALPASLPSDAAQVKVGQLYAGNLPPPGPPLAAAPAPAPTASSLSAPAASWSDVGHFVAANLSPEHGVLLARGSAMADPRWLACAGKPLAVLAAASTMLAPGKSGALDASASAWLKAWRVFSVGAVLVATDPAEAAAVEAAFARAGLPTPVEEDTLMVARSADQYPAIRAGVGARYCVIAVVGRTAADFPNGLTPATSPPTLRPLWGHGWFLLAGTGE